ncbi:MAG: ABC-type septal ring translocating system ATPase component FtsE [Phormidesmis priestleyi Ana]|uniref:Cell division ATP-binding protein FtsE n=1 Tax=Phormidesmis priestleyi Ana TaxID=1666911 RepID=A0A0P7ZKK5_9CYAN|nr:MAG: ABC-type septal ring translocating system ATPase component FtsE [Phormidesmis priestleyi Ana]
MRPAHLALVSIFLRLSFVTAFMISILSRKPRSSAVIPKHSANSTAPLPEPLNQAPAESLGTRPIPTAAPIIALNRVCKNYANNTPALIDINLAMVKGDFLFITGPSGAGKSTLLKMLYGEEKPTTGSIHINGQNIGQLKGDRLAMLRRRIGVVYQDYKLIPLRTVAENVAFVLHAQGYSRKEINRRLPITLKMVGLQDKADRFPSQLSGGEQQRASIARAVVGTPPLLLADEPTGNLDGDNAQQVIKILRRLNDMGITVVVTTHDEAMVQQLTYPVVQIRSHRLYNFR